MATPILQTMMGGNSFTPLLAKGPVYMPSMPLVFMNVPISNFVQHIFSASSSVRPDLTLFYSIQFISIDSIK
jgi:hypothetical protein